MHPGFSSASFAAALLVLLQLALPGSAHAQQSYSQPQLDQIVAPIALYPDPLVASILMASTYPVEVVEANRWLGAGNGSMNGDQLASALTQQPWDPSVKSLVSFPQVLGMMDDNVQWTEQLGDAFLAQEGAVMDSVQRLRHEAYAVGALVSTPQQTVAEQGPYITITPVSTSRVYVPYYDPSQVYGAWPYPSFPPYDFAPPSGYEYGEEPLVFGTGFVVLAPLWGWNSWDWNHHHIDIDDSRFRRLNRDHAPAAQGFWQHDPSHRSGVPYHNAATRAQFMGDSANSPQRQHDFRGFSANPDEIRPARARAEAPILESDTISHPGSFGVYKPNAHILEHPAPKPGQVTVTRGPGSNGTVKQEAYHATPADEFAGQHRPPPAFEAFSHGPVARQEAARGAASRGANQQPRGNGHGNEQQRHP